MRQSRLFPIGVLLLSAALVIHAPLRRYAFSIFRFPLTLARGVLAAVVTVPRLPSLLKENTQLRTTLMQRQLEVAQLREAVRHTQQVQALVTAIPSTDGIVASVIARSTIPTQHTLLLNRGGMQGLVRDSVIVDANGVVGRVIELYPETCLVMLITDPESRVAALVERSRETGLLVGRGRGVCELRYLNAESDIQEGDRIMTAGLGGSFPKGLALGTVMRVIRDEVSGTAQALITPAARLYQLEEVFALPAKGR